MAQVIKKQPTKEPMFSWLIDDHFEKNSTFHTQDLWTYLIVQDDELIGSTTGTTRFGGKTVKLNKKFFSNLKCGFFSKTVKANIFCIKTTHIVANYLSEITVDNKFPTDVPANQSYKNVCIQFTLNLNLTYPEKAYDVFIKNNSSLYTTQDTLKKVASELATRAMNEIMPTVSFPRETHIPNMLRDCTLTPVSEEVFNKFKACYEKMWENCGYKATVNLSRR